MADAADSPKPRRRRRRWLRRTFASFGILLLLPVVVVLLLLANLQSPTVKRYLKGLARAQARVDLEYRGIDVSASGLRIDALVVQSPEAFRAVAPELLRVGSLEVGWSRASLFGLGPKLTEVVIRDVEIVIVRDEDGHTSLDALSPPPDANATPSATPPAPPTPLSKILEEPLKNAPAAASVVIERARLTLLQRNKNREVVERWKLEGAGLSARAEREGKAWRLVTSAGAQKKPLELLLTRDGAKKGEAKALLWLDARATPAGAAAQIDVEIAHQNLAPEVKLARALHLEAEAKFDAANHRTTIAIEKTQLADGAASLAAALEIPDGKPALVRHAEGDLDIDRLIASLPEGVLPVSAKNARLRYKCDQLLLEAVPYFLDGGGLSADGAIGDLRAGSIAASDARLTIEAKPAKDLSSTTLKAKIPIGSIRLARQLSGSGLVVSAEGRLTRALAFTGEVGVGFAQLALAAPQKISARDGRLEVSAHELTVDVAEPLASRGRVEVDGKLGGVDFADANLRALVENATVSAQARLSGKAPYAIDAEIPLERLRLADARGKPMVNGRSKISLHATDIWPDLAHPERTRADAKIAIELDTLKASLNAKKHADALEYQVEADAPSLAPARLVLASLGEVPWEKVGLSLRAHGKIDHLGSRPEIDHHSEVRLDRPYYKNEGGGFSAQAITIVANGSGHARKFSGDLDLRTRALTVNKAKLGDGHVAFKLAADSAAPSLSMKLDADGDGAPKGALTAMVSFDRAKKLVRYELDGSLANLKPIAPMLAAVRGLNKFDLSRLAFSVGGKGTFHGAVEAVSPEGKITLAKNIALTAGGDSTMEVRVSWLAWENDAWEIATPQAIWRGTLSTDGDRRKLHSELTASELHLASVDNLLDFEGIKDALDLTVSGDLRKAEGEMVHLLEVRHLEQDFAESYPVGDVIFAMKGSRNGDGVLTVNELRIDNRAAGTSLLLDGGIDLGERRRSLSLKGKVEQNLQRLSTMPNVFNGRGRVSLALAVDSGNLRVFHARAGVKIEDAWFKMPRSKIEVDAAEGEVPLTADWVHDKNGLRLLRKASINAYSELRFADQHPLLANRSFLSLQRISTPFATAGPLAGNLTVADNLVSLSQLEVGFKSGRITGQCLLNYDGEDSTMQLKVRASHIIADNKEEFDGNISVLIDVGSRSVEGRAEILRIGRRHLLDLLDLHDPLRTDVAVNRIRRALSLGYPDKVRLAFNHGFAGVKVTFGGLASLVRIDELRGIPMGPIIDKVMAKLKPRPEEEPS